MLEVFLIGVIFLLLIFLFILYMKLKSTEQQLSDLQFQKSSQSVKYGKLTEQWIPFSEQFPYTAENFRFIGNPIDGIVFDADEVVFVEFKTATSQLNSTQKQIKDLIEKGKVNWFEFKIK